MLAVLNTTLILLAAEKGSTDPMVYIGAILFALCLMTLGLQRRKAARRSATRDYTGEAATHIRQQQGVREDMESLMLQLSELARQLNGQMDTRYAKLEQTIAEADRRIATLEALLRKLNGGQTLDVIVDDKPTPAEAAKPSQATAAAPSGKSANKSRKASKQNKKAEEQHRPPAKPSSPTTPIASASPAPAAAPMPTAAPAPTSVPTPAIPATAADAPTAQTAPARPAESADARYGRIYALADQGHSPVEIARQTGHTTGEIELILNLRKSQVH